MPASALAGIVIAVASSGAAAQQGGGGSSYTIPMEVRQLTAVSELRSDRHKRALSIYRQLIPHGYSMPSHPLVEMHIVDVSVPQ
ncbi:MAG: hypothetical protein JOZ25_08655, partial [Actinobacteria bacterium]|nr:hypothetical protein [Actinomycetota bacterium]